MLNRELIIRWANELRSGKYTKICGQLFAEEKENACCAIGVCYKILGINNDTERLRIKKEDKYLSFIEKETGIQTSYLQQIYRLNDHFNIRFDEMATKLEELAKYDEVKDEQFFKIFSDKEIEHGE